MKIKIRIGGLLGETNDEVAWVWTEDMWANTYPKWDCTKPLVEIDDLDWAYCLRFHCLGRIGGNCQYYFKWHELRDALGLADGDAERLGGAHQP